jgi:hypothetical protein
MTLPSFQSFIDSLTAHIGWGAVFTTVLTGIGVVIKLLWTLTTNHAEHIQAACERTDQKTNTLVTLAQAQITLLANVSDNSKDAAVALAEIKTLLSVK